ncbi:MAG: type II toxin-antitoxin system RelE/ParE family toxin [Ignavibacterium sp.]|jgi:phage-related protein|nr:type II toxin-antitoxin system RelE/ParE family toxin [Ignavibacterium sp.]
METLVNFAKSKSMKYFETRFLEEAADFISSLDKKSAAKVLYNIDLAEQTNDPKLFKKLKGEIWEFRSQYLGNQNRLLAFWDRTESTETLVFATHGFVKKSRKTPQIELERAERIRQEYFNQKRKK